MYEQRFGIAYVSQIGENLCGVDETAGCFPAALEFEGEDGTGALREIFLSQFIIRRARKGRIVYFRNFRMVFQKIGYFLGVGNVAFNAQGQGFEALDEQPCIERAERCAEVAEVFGADAGYKAGTGDVFDKAEATVGFIRFDQFFEPSRAFPVKIAFFYDKTTQRRAVAADEFSSRMENDIGTVFNVL